MRKTPAPQDGFTLLELLISSSLAAMVMAAVLSSFVLMGRNLSRLASYQALENESRKALAYLRRDFVLAESVKSGTQPTSSNVTLVLPAGEVTYTYDSSAHRLRRQATFGVSRDFTLLKNDQCECTSLTFGYYTTDDAAPTDQSAPGTNVPYSIKQIQIGFVLESPATWSVSVRTRLEAASSRFLLRNRGAPDGT